MLKSTTTATLAASYMLLLLSLQSNIQICNGFISLSPQTKTRPTCYVKSEVQTPNTSIEASSSNNEGNNDEDATINGLPKLTGALEKSTLQTFELTSHKPLGCHVEESLADEPNNAKYVFVAEVNNGGNAYKAGIKVGDVIVQLSGTFDEVVDATGLGIEKIRSLVGGRHEESPLIIRVARGSDVKERHELALVELCIIGDDAQTAECITQIYADDEIDMGDADIPECNEDDDMECMLDSVWNDWADAGVIPSAVNGEEEVEEEPKQKKKVQQPWASRSSGSGTYVRDPKTGKMVNIDE